MASDEVEYAKLIASLPILVVSPNEFRIKATRAGWGERVIELMLVTPYMTEPAKVGGERLLIKGE